jgi:putative peptidoglycan lipid II flippase
MTRAAGRVGALTLVSRVLGFVRDAVIAAVFGASAGADAFIVAFRIPNLWRRLVFEGALTVVFIPIFLDILARQGPGAAFGMAGAVLRRVALILCVGTGVGLWAAPFWVTLLAPGFSGRPDDFRLAVSLARMMLPYLPLVGAAAICMAVLQALGRFAAPALGPIAFNLAMIGGVLGLSGWLDGPARALSIGVLMGGALQLLLPLAEWRRTGAPFRGRPPAGEGISAGRLALRAVPATLGASVFQINILVATLLASFLPEGRVAALYFADRLAQFPLGVVVAALATATLPSLSRHAAAGEWETFQEDARFALRVAMYLTLPAAAGLTVLREPIVAVLFGRGAFDPAAVRWTAEALVGFAAAVPVCAGVRVASAASFAAGNTRAPLTTGGGAMVINALLGGIGGEIWGVAGITLSLALATAFHLGMLLRVLRPAVGLLCDRVFWKSACQSAVGSLIMSTAAIFVARLLPPTGGSGSQAAALVAAIAAGMAAYAIFSLCIRHPEFTSLLKSARKE